jgi:hypothetical protein
METLRVSRPLTVGAITLIAIEHTTMHTAMGTVGYQLSGFIKVDAVLVCDEGEVRAFDTDSTEIELDVLKQKIPELDGLLAGL